MEEQQYLDALEKAAQFGRVKGNRTKNRTRSYFGNTMRFTLFNQGRRILPLLTTKDMSRSVDAIFKELEWFIRGQTDAKILSERGVKIWDANGSRQFLDSVGLVDNREGDLGPVYGFQWRHFGADYVGADHDYSGQGVDQLAKVIDTIKTNPYDRRLVVSAWNPTAIDKMALPPCFTENNYVLTPDGYKKISSVMKSDTLYTHSGVFCQINAKHITKYKGEILTIHLKHGLPIECTPDHPVMTERDWIPAGELIPASCFGQKFMSPEDPIRTQIRPDYVGVKINTRGFVHKVTYGDEIITLQPEHWFMIGYFISHGNFTGTPELPMIAFDETCEVPRGYIYNKLQSIMTISYKQVSPVKTIYESTDSKWIYVLVSLLAPADETRRLKIPACAGNLPINHLEAFITGLGTSKFIDIADAMLIQMFYMKIGQLMGITHNADERYELRQVRTDAMYIRRGYCWFMVDKILRDRRSTEVYNFDVQSDHSYTVNNVAVHNCHIVYQFNCEPAEQGDYLDCLIYQRSADLPLGVPFNIASYAALTHIVSALTDKIPRDLIYITGDTHIYEDQLSLVPAQLFRKPYASPELRIAGLTNLDNFRAECLSIHGYRSWPAIRYPFSV